MLKWTYVALAIGWAGSMVYEWLWSGCTGTGGYFTLGAVGVTVLMGLFIRQAARRRRSKEPLSMLWFLSAAVVCALFYSALERTVQGQLTHVPFMPLYLALFADFFATGCYIGWKKLKKNRRD